MGREPSLDLIRCSQCSENLENLEIEELSEEVEGDFGLGGGEGKEKWNRG